MKKRSITSPHGHQINITLEAEFWAVIDASIAEGPQSFAGFISQREHEFMEDGQTGDLARYLRDWCSARAKVEKNINDKTSHVTLGQNDFSWIWQAHQTNNATPVSAATTRLSIFRQHIVSGGTDTHIVLLDLSAIKLSGKEAESILDQANITSNKNPVPFDVSNPNQWSGLRLGVAAATTRGFKQTEFEQLGRTIASLLTCSEDNCQQNIIAARSVVEQLCVACPIYNR